MSKNKAFLSEWADKQQSIQAMVEAIVNLKKGSLRTVKAYVQAVHDFCCFVGNENADSVLVSFRNMKEDDIVTQIQNYVNHNAKRLTGKSNNSLICGIKRWFIANRFRFAWEFVEKPSTQVEMEDRALTVEELRLVLGGDKLSLRDKAFIIVAATTGLRIGTLLTLKYGDVVFDLEPELRREHPAYETMFTPTERLGIRQIAMVKVKTAPGRKLRGKNSYFGFMTSEAVQVLRQYLDWRKRCGEQLTTETWLFGKEQPKHTAEPVAVTPMTRSWTKILINNGFQKNGQKWHPLHFQTLRKFHYTHTSSVKGLAYVWRGQKQGEYLDDAYLREELDKHVKEFLKVEPRLRIAVTPNEELLLKTADQATNAAQRANMEIESLKQTIQKLEERVVGLGRGQLHFARLLEAAQDSEGKYGKFLQSNCLECGKRVLDWNRVDKEGFRVAWCETLDTDIGWKHCKIVFKELVDKGTCPHFKHGEPQEIEKENVT
jgi:integrase